MKPCRCWGRQQAQKQKGQEREEGGLQQRGVFPWIVCGKRLMKMKMMMRVEEMPRC